LQAAAHAFDLLTRPPAALMFEGRTVAGLPRRVMGLDELRQLLLAPGTSSLVRERVWAQLVTHARQDGPAWVVAAVGIALPALTFRAGQLTRGWHGDVADLDGELLLGFLERLASIDPDAENVAARLVESGARAVKRARRYSERLETIRATGPQSFPPARPWDHPDLVLARAVTAGVIGPEEAQLIALTRLESVPLWRVAQRLGISTILARAWRRRAELALGEAIGAGELQWVLL
jgi:hypothetical protein